MTKTLLDVVNGHTEQIAAIAEKMKAMNCEYNMQHIEELHNENEGLSLVFGEGYVTKLREMEAEIDKIKTKINEMIIKYEYNNQKQHTTE